MAIHAVLFYDRIVIPNPQEGMSVYKSGFYGKPLGIAKPKKDEDLKRPLEVSLIEGLYLVKKGKIEVYNIDNKMDENDLEKYAKSIINRFDILYAVYEDLRNKGFIVRSGIKFGADFAIYTLGPGIEHAPYVIIALDENAKLMANELMSFGRVSHSTKKKLVLGLVNLNTRSVRYIIFKWVKM